MAKLTSDVYKHFEERDGRYYCMAVGCTKSYKKTGSTSNMLFHYRDKHDEDDSGQPFRNWPRLKATVAEEREVYESAVVTFFAAYGVPFHAVNSQEFLHLIASAGGHQKTISRQKLSEEILTREASQCEYEVRSVLEKQNISLCVDEYTKGSNRFLSVTATLVNSTFHHQTVRVAVVSLDVQRATAENLRKVIEDQLRRYKIRGEDLIALTRDGGANMVKLGRLMGLPSVHCFCHVLNLCVNSPLIYKRFKDFAGGKVLKMPNSTRWNSTYEMIQSFCKLHEKLREFASGLENQYSAISVGIYTALSLDMAEINSLCKTLKFLKDICLLAEGRRSCASIIFYLIRRIEDHCAKQSQSQSTTPLCQDVNDTILRTLQKHKSEYLKSDMLLICTYLDPRFVDHPNILERTDWMRARQLLADMCEQRLHFSSAPFNRTDLQDDLDRAYKTIDKLQVDKKGLDERLRIVTKKLREVKKTKLALEINYVKVQERFRSILSAVESLNKRLVEQAKLIQEGRELKSILERHRQADNKVTRLENDENKTGIRGQQNKPATPFIEEPRTNRNERPLLTGKSELTNQADRMS
ncbi:hypothetical protein QR680_003569 [Steinernema hermaphroditum]|uniref:BED-type domain-containing protein n=1 Tax=Steinernema hermaphroditum TaxID=289476 RepID=A0AA39HKU8_9BILA|nr:hypothetical protein QR680_003569 [Steinernema hermaphroditum]